MRVALLTTETVHHAWYLEKIIQQYSHMICISENKQHLKNKEACAFDQNRDAFEARHFFPDRSLQLRDICETIEVDDVNSPLVLGSLKNADIDAIVTFGTGKIKGELITFFHDRLINLHGGHPEQYRGLDSHLWAAYHDDWEAMITTIHMLNENLDDGAIIATSKLDLSQINELHELRAINTHACVDLTLVALRQYASQGKFSHTRQKSKGRYFSAMPDEYKIICEQKFRQYKDNQK